ncbi:MAG TPA: acyl carrier protein [Bacteroidales bacterium]|nr:acyl carrier protein [Bacteroidales bacterium]
MNMNQQENTPVCVEEKEKSPVLKEEQIKDQLIGFICRQFLVDPEDIQLDKSLVDTGIIDSMGLIEIASFIQQKFSFTVREDQMNRKNFGSVLLIVNFIESNLK